MVLTGTLFNTIAVATGASIGLLSRKVLPASAQKNILVVFGLFTLALSIQMITEAKPSIDIFLALVLGSLIGTTLKLDHHFSKLELGSGFMKATLLFCVGGMTLVGCMNEGIKDDTNLLMIKGVMDLISAFFLAAALGRGVLFSAIGVLIIQGCMTIGFFYIGEQISPELVDKLTVTGGIILLALGLDLMNIKEFKILNLIPAFILLPVIHYLHSII